MLQGGPAGSRPPLPHGIVCHLTLYELSMSVAKRIVKGKYKIINAVQCFLFITTNSRDCFIV